MKEGFWKSRFEPDLPMPIANDLPWDGQETFLKAFWKKERGASVLQAKGFSLCRVCRCINGSEEYHRDDWEWPSGLRHYVEEHNVKPSEEFIAWVLTNG